MPQLAYKTLKLKIKQIVNSIEIPISNIKNVKTEQQIRDYVKHCFCDNGYDTMKPKKNKKSGKIIKMYGTFDQAMEKHVIALKIKKKYK